MFDAARAAVSFWLKDFWQRLNQREKFLLVLGVIALSILLWVFALMPLFSELTYKGTNRQFRQQITELHTNLNRLQEVQAKNAPLANPLEEKLQKIRQDLKLKEPFEIRQDKNPDYGTNWVVRTSELRSDQVLQLIYEIENLKPVAIIDRLEVAESLQTRNFSRITLLIRTE